jgi:predicted transglutaminase-like cysteine proteinase
MSGFLRALLRALCLATVLAAAPGAADETIPGTFRMAALAPEHAFARSIENSRSEPFRARYSPGSQSRIVAKWRAVMEAMRRDGILLDACRAQPDTCMLPAADTFLKIEKEALLRTGRARIGEINRAVNLGVRASDDARRFGMPDRWTSPLETLGSTRGDCEDYAIAKYALLRAAGFADADLRLVIVRLPLMRVDHAVLAVRYEGRWLILDNRRFAMLDAEYFADEALFVLGAGEGAKVPEIHAGAHFGAMPLVL